MSALDTKELAGGLFLVTTGLLSSGYALAHYSIGSVTKMGPGMVPAALGVLLVVFGTIVAIGAFTKGRDDTPVRVFVPLMILLSVLAFALMITGFGLFPAVIACVVVATLAEGAFRPVFSLTLAAALCAFAWAVFVLGLQLPIPLYAWPF